MTILHEANMMKEREREKEKKSNGKLPSNLSFISKLYYYHCIIICFMRISFMYIQLFNRSLCVDLYSLYYVCTYTLSKETTTYVYTFENFRSQVKIFLRWPEVKRVIIIESIETTVVFGRWAISRNSQY